MTQFQSSTCAQTHTRHNALNTNPSRKEIISLETLSVYFNMSGNEKDEPTDEDVKDGKPKDDKPKDGKGRKTKRIGQDNEEEAELTISYTPDEG